jgi:hypothetical protein
MMNREGRPKSFTIGASGSIIDHSPFRTHSHDVTTPSGVLMGVMQSQFYFEAFGLPESDTKF